MRGHHVIGALLFFIVLFFLGLSLMYAGYKDYLFSRTVNNTAATKISSTTTGPVRLIGRAACTEPAESPVSKTRCVFWRVVVHYYEENECGKITPESFAVQSPKAFYVQDNAGRMLINPEGAVIDIDYDIKYEGVLQDKGRQKVLHDFLTGPVRMFDDTVQHFLESLDSPVKEQIMNQGDRSITILEYFINVNDPLYIMGNAVPQAGDAGAVKGDTLIIRKGADNGTLYLAEVSQEQVAFRYFSRATGKIVLGLPMSTISLVLFALNFHMIWVAILCWSIFLGSGAGYVFWKKSRMETISS